MNLKIKTFLNFFNFVLDANLTDPVLLSFWLARNIPLTEKTRISLFMSNSVSHRMLLIGKSLKDVCFE